MGWENNKNRLKPKNSSNDIKSIKITRWTQMIQELKHEHFSLALFPKDHSCKILLFFSFSFFFVKHVSVWGSGNFQMHRCLWLHASSLLGTINSVESKVIQSSISHFSKVLQSVEGVINGVQQWHRLPPAHESSLILMQLSYWSKQTNLGVQRALCLI